VDSRGNVFTSPEDADALLALAEEAMGVASKPRARRLPLFRPLGAAGPRVIEVSPEVMAALLKLGARARRVYYGARKRDPEHVALAKAKASAANDKRGRRR